MNAEINDRELQAHLYQQLHRLEPYTKLSGQLMFAEDKIASSERKESDHESVTVKLRYVTPVFIVEAEGYGSDEYEASSSAVETMIEQLIELNESEENTTPRADVIQQIQDHPYLH